MKTRRYRNFDMRSFSGWKPASEFPTLKQPQKQEANPLAYILFALCCLLLFYYIIK